MKKVSVIIPTYKGTKTIKRALESVIHQDMDDWELIVVDDNDPASEERNAMQNIMSEYISRDARIQYLCHPANKNGSAARNTGITNSCGEYIAFLDDDDEYLPSRLRKCAEALTAHNEYSCVYTGVLHKVDGKDYRKFSNPKSGNFLAETLACVFPLCTGSNLFFKRCVLDNVGLFDESFLRQQDYEYLARIFMKYNIYGLREVLVIKHKSIHTNLTFEKLYAIRMQYLDKFRDDIESCDANGKRLIYMKNYVSLAEKALREGNTAAAKRCYDTAQKYGKLSLKENLKRLYLTYR